MGRQLVFTVIASLLSTTVAAQSFSSGEKQVSLLELFTSQGCSSCPPAEHWLSEWQDSPELWTEVVPVVWHVDYWDTLGWRDRFSSPRWSQRQRDYRIHGDVSGVYTPGFVVNGQEWRGWFTGQTIPNTAQDTGKLSLDLERGKITAHYDGTETGNNPLQLHVALLGSNLQTAVAAGENAGKTLDHDFVVLGLADTTSNDGKWTLELPGDTHAAAPGKALAAWVTQKGSFKPLQATGGWLN